MTSGTASREQPSDRVSIEQIAKYSEDVVIIGSRESGKTTIAHQICILAINGLVDRPRIPAIIDMRRSTHVNDVKKGIHAYLSHEGYEMTADAISKELRENFDSCDFIVCLDNFDPTKSFHFSALIKMKTKHSNIRFVLLCDEPTSFASGASRLQKILPGITLINIQPLSRKMIRELSNKKLQARKVTDPDISDYIVRQFSQNDLPRTGYIVTLLLWAWEKKLKAERLNEAVLLQAFTDHLLDTADFTGAVRGTFDAKLKMLLLQELAQRMSNSGGIENVLSLQGYLREFFETKGLEFDAIETLEILCKSGILKKTWNDVSFRYRCFQEFFHALYLSSNSDAANKITNIVTIIDNEREIDLLTALERRTRGFSEIITSALGAIFGYQQVH